MANITKLTATQIAHLKKGCPVLSKYDLGTAINKVIDSANKKTTCKLTIAESDIKKLDNMCSLNKVKIGTLISEMILAENNKDKEVSDINEEQIEALNGYGNGGCKVLRTVGLGTTLKAIIDKLNAETPEVLTSVTIPQSLSIDALASEEVSITWNPTTIINKGYTLTTSDETKATVSMDTSDSDTKFIINGISEGTAVITLTPDADPTKEVECTVTINVAASV